MQCDVTATEPLLIAGGECNAMQYNIYHVSNGRKVRMRALQKGVVRIQPVRMSAEQKEHGQVRAAADAVSRVWA